MFRGLGMQFGRLFASRGVVAASYKFGNGGPFQPPANPMPNRHFLNNRLVFGVGVASAVPLLYQKNNVKCMVDDQMGMLSPDPSAKRPRLGLQEDSPLLVWEDPEFKLLDEDNKHCTSGREWLLN